MSKKNIHPHQEVKSINYQEQLDQLQQDCDKLKEKYARSLADYQNLLKRTQTQQTQYIKLASVPLLEKLIPLFDHLDLASKHINDQGLTMIIEQLQQLLQEEKVVQFEPLGETFNPQSMECVELVEGKANHVVEVIQKGYRLDDYLIRPAKVKVGQSTKDK